jgi:MFS family permease
MLTQPTFSGKRTFYTIWGGQAISMIGTAMSRFALIIWAYQQTGAATTLALLGFFNYGTFVLTSPLAGVLIDRFSRKRIMLLADLGAALMSATVFVLFGLGRLEIWHLFALEALTGLCEAFQWPAYQASVTLLMPREALTRANSLNGLADSLARVLAPALAGVLLPLAGIQTVLAIDLATFLIAFCSLALVFIPRPQTQNHTIFTLKQWKADFNTGFKFITQRPGLLGLTLVFGAINLFAGLTYYSILSAMILARSGQNASALGLVESALGLGGVAGGLVLSAWGGPKKRVRGLLLACGVSFLLGDGSFAAGQSLPVWMMAGFLSTFFIPFIVAPNQSIWQTKTPPELQGRVFSLRSMLQMTTLPLGYLLAGPLADQFFEPGMRVGGAWTPLFAWLTGSGPGAGMGLMFACTAVCGVLVGLISYLIPAVRHIEDDLPDTV